MAGEVQRIDTGTFAAAVEGILAAVKAFADMKTNVISSTDILLPCWEGKGKEQFENAYNNLKTHLQDEEENLQELADSLKDIEQAYQGWDSEISRQLTEGAAE